MNNIIQQNYCNTSTQFKIKLGISSRIQFYSFLLVALMVASSCTGQNLQPVKGLSRMSGLESNTPWELNLAKQAKSGNRIFTSPDGGKTWQNLRIMLPKDLSISCVHVINKEVYIGTSNGGLYHSDDVNKNIWQKEDIDNSFQKEFISSVFSGSSGIYVSVYEHGFFRKTKGTNHWQPIHSPLTNPSINSLYENEDGTLVIGCTDGVYTSTDDSKTWRHVLNAGWVSSLSGNGGVIVANSEDGILRSTDKGEHWNCELKDQGGIYQTSVFKGKFSAIRLAGSSTTFNNTAAWLGIQEAMKFRSSIDGKNWQFVNNGLSGFREIYDLKQSSSYLFCSHKRGVSRSSDGGKHWEQILKTTITENPYILKVAVSDQTTIAFIGWQGC